MLRCIIEEIAVAIAAQRAGAGLIALVGEMDWRAELSRLMELELEEPARLAA
jgi:hypothetical protein